MREQQSFFCSLEAVNPDLRYICSFKKNIEIRTHEKLLAFEHFLIF